MKKSVKSIVSNKEWLVGVLADSTYNSYWGRFGVHTDTPKDIYENAKLVNECREEIWADVLLNGGFFLVEDLEDEKEYKLSLKDFEKGLRKLISDYPQNYTNIMTEEGDYYDNDAMLQCAVFGDVIYG